MAHPFVQAATSNITGQDALQRSIAFGSDVVNGNMILACITTFNAGITLSLTDSQLNVYTQINTYSGASDTSSVSLWYAIAGTSGPCTFKWTPSGSAFSNAGVVEYKLYNQRVSFDGVNRSFATSANLTTGNINVTNGGELKIGAFGGAFTTGTVTPMAGLNTRCSQTTGTTETTLLLFDDNLSSASGAITATLVNSGDWCGIGISLRLVPDVYAPEVRSSPMPGSPAFQLQPAQSITYFSNPPVTVFVSPPTPETRDGPMPGSPMFHLRPAQGITYIQAIAPIIPQGAVSPITVTGPPMPGTPWFNLQMATSRPILFRSPPLPDIIVVQQVTAASKFSINQGVLASGRRPDRPGS